MAIKHRCSTGCEESEGRADVAGKISGKFDARCRACRVSRRYAQKQCSSMTDRPPSDGLINTRMKSRSRVVPFKRFNNGEAKWFLHDFIEWSVILTVISVKKKRKKKRKNPLGNFTSISLLSSGH